MLGIVDERTAAFVTGAANVAERQTSFRHGKHAWTKLCGRKQLCPAKGHSSGCACMSDQLSRRHFARALLLNAALTTEFVKPSSAGALQSPFAAPENLAQKAPPRPKARLFEEDIFYPDYFAGVWETESKLISVMCPAGYKLFGRPGSFESARRVRFLI